MTNKEFIKAVADANGVTQKAVTEMLDMVEVELKNRLSEKEASIKFCDITITNKVREAHEGRNPKTGESISIPEKSTLSFKRSIDWNRVLNG